MKQQVAMPAVLCVFGACRTDACVSRALTCGMYLACFPYLNPLLSYPNLILTILLPYFAIDMSREGRQAAS